MTEPTTLFKALGDDLRLRAIRALDVAELSVAEIGAVLGLTQSSISRHLKILREAGLVDTRRDGTTIYYRRGARLRDNPTLGQLVDEQAAQIDLLNEDRASVRRMLDRRTEGSRDFFDRIAGSYGTLTEPGGGWPALAAGLAAGFAGQDVADLGAGEGDLTLLLARYARRVTAVDASARMLRVIEDRADAAGVARRVRTVEGDLEKLPLRSGSMDALFLSQALHHVATPEKTVREAARVLRPGGPLVVLDLARHEQEWVREQWADLWLGFTPEELTGWLAAAGLEKITVERLAGSTPELAVLLVVGWKKKGDRQQR